MLCPQMVFHWFSYRYVVGITDQAAINNSFVQIIMFIQALSCRICFVTLVTFKEKFQNFLGPREYPNHKNFWKFFLGRVETFYKDHLNKRLRIKFKCDQCDKTYSTRKGLNEHYNLHEGIIYCCLIFKLTPSYISPLSICGPIKWECVTYRRSVPHTPLG